MAIGIKAQPITWVAHVLAIAGAAMVLVWCIHFRGGLAWEASTKTLIFNIHPVLMLIGFIILGGEGTVSRAVSTIPLLFLRLHPSFPNSHVNCKLLMKMLSLFTSRDYPKQSAAIMSYKSLPLKKDVKKLIHLVLHAAALILGIIGIYTAFKFHNESGIVNLYSLHSWLGIAIISLYGIQWIYGFLVFFYPGGTAAIRTESLPWHVLFGLFVFVLAVANAAIGFLEKLTFLENSGLDKYGSESLLVNFTAVVTILYGAFVVIAALSQAPAEDDYSYSAL